MKKFYLSILSLFVSASLFAVNVTFSVDMTGQTVNAGGVHVAGSFQSEAGATGDWLPGATVLTDQGSGIWSITVDIPAGYYEYKFVNGTNWGQDESPAAKCNVNGNRAVSVGAVDMTLPTPLFGQCPDGGSFVLFQVNLKAESFLSPNGIHVAGSFQSEAGFSGDWKESETMLFSPDNDSIYKYVAQLPTGSFEYKFLNGDSWGDDETVPSACATNNNRAFTNDSTQALVLSAVAFGGCPPGVVFQVDMSDETVSPNGVHVSGGFNGWDPAATLMTDKGSGIWEATVQMAPGNYEYKFVNGNTNGDYETVPGACATNGNRSVNVTGGITVPVVKFGKCQPKLTLRVDMSLQTVSADSVHVAGGFQGWDPSTTQMTHIGNGIYEVTIEVPAGTYEYKFVNGNAWGSDESVPGACNTNGNRSITIGASDVIANTVCFKQCGHPCVVDPAAADITFRVDMDYTGITVESSGVWMICSFTSPAWQDGRVQLTDADNDMVYEATINISGAADIQYKFCNGEPVPGSAFENGETGDFATLGCGVSNGIGGFNRTHTRSGSAEVLDIVTYNFCDRQTKNGIVNTGNLEHLSIYPNPAQQTVNIQYSNVNGNGFDVKIMDLSGRVVGTANSATNGILNVDISQLTKGAYFVYVTEVGSGKTGFQKLIVQ